MGLLAVALRMKQLAAKPTVATGTNGLYFKTDGVLYKVDSSGTEKSIEAASLTHHASRANAAGTSILNGTGDTIVPWATAGSLDGITYASNSFTLPVTGRYSIGAVLSFVTNSTGYRKASVYVNGTLYRQQSAAPTPSGTGQVGVASINIVDKFSAGDVIAIYASQNSGAALALAASSSANYVYISYVGPAAP